MNLKEEFKDSQVRQVLSPGEFEELMSLIAHIIDMETSSLKKQIAEDRVALKVLCGVLFSQ